MKYLILLLALSGSVDVAEADISGLWWERGSDRVLKIEGNATLSRCRLTDQILRCGAPYASLTWDDWNGWYDVNVSKSPLFNGVVRILNRPYLRFDGALLHRGEDFFESKIYERINQ